VSFRYRSQSVVRVPGLDTPRGRAALPAAVEVVPDVAPLLTLGGRHRPARRGTRHVRRSGLHPDDNQITSTPHRTANASSRRNSRGTQARRRPETMEMLSRRCARMESTWWVAAVKAGRPLSRGPIRPRSPLLCAPRACRPWCFCLLSALWSRRPRRLGPRRFGCRHGLTRRGLISALVRGPFSFWRLGDGRHQWLLCRLFSHTDGFLGLLGLRRLDPRSGCLAGRLARRRDPATWSMARTPPARGARHEVVEHLLIQGCIWYSGCRHCPSR
jgi:hypothetical protein